MKPPYSRVYFDLLREQARATPDALAVICGERQISYAALMAAASKLAAAMRARGVRRGDRVGTLINNRLEWAEICFASSALGAVTVPFSTWSKQQELEFLIADSRIRILFMLGSFGHQNFAESMSNLISESVEGSPGQWSSSRFPNLQDIVVLDAEPVRGWTRYSDFASGYRVMEALPPGEGPSATDDVLITYTSGTSARPKAVRSLHYGVIENGFNIGERQGLVQGDRVLLAPPLFWYYAAGNAVSACFTHGATLVLQGRFVAREAIELIERHRCTAIYTLPNITRGIVEQPDFDRSRTSSLRTGLTIGTSHEVRVAAEQLAAPLICNLYGLTETYGNCCVTPSTASLDYRIACQGPPLPGFTIRIVDPESGLELPTGAVGAIEVSGYIMPGYGGESAQFNDERTFTKDGFFRTGDLGSLDESGAMHFHGRNTDMIKAGGINVSPAEIEELLLGHPDVAQVIVVGVPAQEQGEEIVAFVVPARGKRLTSHELDVYCRARVSTYKIPSHFSIRDVLPTTTTGKISRRELKAIWADQSAALSGG